MIIKTRNWKISYIFLSFSNNLTSNGSPEIESSTIEFSCTYSRSRCVYVFIPFLQILIYYTLNGQERVGFLSTFEYVILLEDKCFFAVDYMHKVIAEICSPECHLDLGTQVTKEL